jgi:hypothetical protein
LLPDDFWSCSTQLHLSRPIRGQGVAGDHLKLLRSRTISSRDLCRNPALSVDEHGWPEEKERLKSLNLEEWADRHSHSVIDSLLSSFVISARVRYPSQNVFAVGNCVSGKHAPRLDRQRSSSISSVSLTLLSELQI